MLVIRDDLNRGHKRSVQPSLKFLLDSDALKPGEPLVLMANSIRHFGRLLADGYIEASGEVFSSLSAWARKATGVVRNPWPIVYARGQSLASIRKATVSLSREVSDHHYSPMAIENVNDNILAAADVDAFSGFTSPCDTGLAVNTPLSEHSAMSAQQTCWSPHPDLHVCSDDFCSVSAQDTVGAEQPSTEESSETTDEVTLFELLSSGLLLAGTRVVLMLPHQQVVGTLTAAGNIECGSTVYDSPYSWANSFSEYAVNGWSLVRTTEGVTLAELRKAYTVSVKQTFCPVTPASLLAGGLAVPGDLLSLETKRGRHFGRILPEGTLQETSTFAVFTSLPAWCASLRLSPHSWRLIVLRGRRLDALGCGDQLTLKDLVEAGVLPVDAVITVRSSSAVVSADGSLWAGDQCYDSLPAWARGLIGARCNVWRHAKFGTCSLADLRLFLGLMRLGAASADASTALQSSPTLVSQLQAADTPLSLGSKRSAVEAEHRQPPSSQRVRVMLPSAMPTLVNEPSGAAQWSTHSLASNIKLSDVLAGPASWLVADTTESDAVSSHLPVPVAPPRRQAVVNARSIRHWKRLYPSPAYETVPDGAQQQQLPPQPFLFSSPTGFAVTRTRAEQSDSQ